MACASGMRACMRPPAAPPNAAMTPVSADLSALGVLGGMSAIDRPGVRRELGAVALWATGVRDMLDVVTEEGVVWRRGVMGAVVEAFEGEGRREIIWPFCAASVTGT